MSFTLKIRMRKAEGCLVRLLGLVARRGYEVRAFTARLAADGAVYDIRLDFLPLLPKENAWYRSPEVLARMVEKLVDVEKVDLSSEAGPPGGEHRK